MPICHILVAIVHKFHPLKEKLRQYMAGKIWWSEVALIDSPRQGIMLFMSLVQGVDPWFEANDRPIILYSVNIRRTTSLSAISP